MQRYAISRSIAACLLLASYFARSSAPTLADPLAPATQTTLTPDFRLAWRDDAALHDVAFVDRQWGWAVGDHGAVWHTQDGGQTWQLQPAPGFDPLASVSVVDRERAFVVGGALAPTLADLPSHGVVLQTLNGGATWQPIAASLPALSWVKFFTAERGVAVGLGTAAHPAGMFVTSSGGTGWRPLRDGTRQAWSAADFLDGERGIAVGVGGRAVQIVSGSFEFTGPLDAAGRTLRDVVLTPSGQGWLVGDGGVALSTYDAGRTWRLVESLPAALTSSADLLSVATVDAHVWIVGSPGSLVFHSADQGRTWETQPTGVTTPLRCVTFVDALCGWAVGDLGVILATRDGGATWQTQRGAERRVAFLQLVANVGDASCETLAEAAADQGYRSAVHALVAGNAGPLHERLTAEMRLAEVVRRVGANSSSVAWQISAPSPRLDLDADAALSAVEGQRNGQATRLLKDGLLKEGLLKVDLVRRIRQWRPSVVLLPAAPSPRERPLDDLVHRMAREALAEAADATAHAQLAVAWRLPPWKVERVLAAAPAGERGVCRIDVQRSGRRLGRPLVDLAATSRALLSDPLSCDRPTMETFVDRTQSAPSRAGRLLGDARGDVREYVLVSGIPPVRGDDLFSGLSIPPGDAAQRAWEVREENRHAIGDRRLALRRHSLRSALPPSAATPGWLMQGGDVVEGLDADQGSAALYELAARHLERGEALQGAEVCQELVRRFGEHPLADAALAWLAPFYASGEAAHVYMTNRRQLGGDRLADPSSGPIDAVQLATAEEPPSGLDAAEAVSLPAERRSIEAERRDIEAQRRKKRRDYVVQLMEYIVRTRPGLAEQPQLRFPWAIAIRQQGDVQTADRYFDAWQRRERNHPWRACALADRWRREGSLASGSTSSGPLPTAMCWKADDPPRLDGILDDALWQKGRPMPLQGADASETDTSVAGAELRFAYDADYLYFSVESEQAPHVGYPVDASPRPHDASLAGRDRVRLLLDVDRDFVTWYELDVDSRGFTGDRCLGDAHWNPEWYVASQVDQARRDMAGERLTWRIEAAIPWTALAPVAPQSRDAWAMAVERIIPGHGFQTVAGPPGVQPVPENGALLVFE